MTLTSLSYNKPGLSIQKNGPGATDNQIRDLQQDLRRLGYLRNCIDGKFGAGTELAVMALQYDLLHNAGKSFANDGLSPVRMIDYNKGRVLSITGIVDESLAGCMSDMLKDSRLPLLPKTENPKKENSFVIATIKNMSSLFVPAPYLTAIFKQESGLKHYNEPQKNDDDTYIVVGLDTNAAEKYVITSRGYGVGQYTLFHHPPTQKEVEDFMLDVTKNIQKGALELKEKFDHFVNGQTSGTQADDRIAEAGHTPLRLCMYAADDPLYMKNCKECAAKAGQKNIKEGTAVYEGSQITFTPTDYYKKASYLRVPIRKNIPCDWPYAARRYNGSGINSYHYQTKVLLNLLDPG
ncbi:MAG: hypothetical protein C0399_04140 [Syntrophus sp. (in: bacteria)]|nr:hypothetical protein [Syntrophus sp. (in: bacteria)]